MCGICGIVDFQKGPPSRQTLEAMTKVLSHRGPDDSGVFLGDPVGLGHTRLSIIDLSSAGHQPMTSHNGQFTIVYNGELYNHIELRGELEAHGTAFRSHSDTEVFLEAFARWGTAAFARFNGMFAAAIWDAKTRALTLVRDRFGIKPLYLFRLPAGTVFGSEIKAILASGRVDRQIDYAALHEYLYFGNALGERTMFHGITRLLPGSWLTLHPAQAATGTYWSIADVVQRNVPEAEAIERTRELLGSAVESHLISDVPVGVFLSGGIDSSAITALASRSGRRLTTFSVGFGSDAVLSELPRARKVAAQFGTEHHELLIEAGNLADVLESLVMCHDEPFSDPANVPLYMLTRELQGTIKVVLQGDGGDEIFAGYRRYNVFAHERFWQLAAWSTRPFRRFLPHRKRLGRMARFLTAMDQASTSRRIGAMLSSENLRFPPTSIMTSAVQEQLCKTDPFARYENVVQKLMHLDPTQRTIYADTTILLPDTYLEKVDKSTMAHGIEVRVPFLDGPLSEYVIALPAAMKVRRLQKKWVLRQALRGIVPDHVLDAPKTGFSVPVSNWMRFGLGLQVRQRIASCCEQSELFDPTSSLGLIDSHLLGRRDYGVLVYRMYLLAIWLEQYF